MLLLACLALVIYLASVGIPRFVLDQVEAEARKQGIELNIQSARLGYGSGLSFILREVSLELSDDTKRVPRLELGRLRVGLRVSPLLQGKIKPYLIRIKRSRFNLESEHGDADGLSIKDINLTCTINHRNVLQVVSTTPLNVEGMLITLKADLPYASEQPSSHQQAIVNQPDIIGDLVSAWIDANQDSIDAICQFVAQQDWSDKEQPRINISYNAINTPRCSFDVAIPSLYYEKLCFNHVVLNGDFSNDILQIHQLVLHSPKAEPSSYLGRDEALKCVFQGGYNTVTRQLSFTLDSSMPLLSIMSNLVSSEDFKLFDRIAFSSKEHSEMQLQGDVLFGEDVSISEASILGYLMQRDIQVDRYTIDEMVLSFYLKDGNIAIDQAQIKMGDGFVSAQSHLNNGNGAIEIDASLTLEQVMLLAETFVSEGVQIDLPEQLKMDEPVKLHAMAKMISPDFQRGQLAMDEFLPEIDSLELRLSVPEMSNDGFRFSRSELQASTQKLHAFDLSQHQLAKQVKVKLSIEEAQFDQHVGAAGTQENSLNGQMSEGLEAAQMNKHQEWEHLELETSLGEIRFQEILPEGGRSGLCFQDIDLRASAQGLRGKYVSVDKLDLAIKDLKRLELSKPKDADLSACHLDLDARQLAFKGEDIEQLSLTTHFERLEQFATDICCTINQAEGQAIQLRLDKNSDGQVRIRDLKAMIPSALLNTIIPQDVLKARGYAFPEQTVSLDGRSDLNWLDGELRFDKGSFNLHIPRLSHHSVHVKPHAEVFNELDVQVELNVYRGNDDAILFDSPHFSLSKGNRSLSGSLICKESGLLEFKVNSNLLLDTLDELIDDHLTHLIMRDFSMNEDSDVLVKNLNLTVDVRHGVDVQATGQVELHHINALLGTYDRVADPEGILNQEDVRSKEPCKQLPTKIIRGLADVVVDVHLDPAPEGETARVLTKSLISINQVSLQFDNKPWLRKKKIKGGATESTLRARSVVLDTKNNFVSIHEAKGAIYPDYAIGTFFAPLRDFLEVLDLSQPVDVETYYCIFPIALNSEVAMDGSIAMASHPSFDLNLLGASFPLQRFSGYIDFRKGGVYLDKLNAIFCEGVANGCILLTITGKSMGYDGYLNLASCNFEEIAKLFDTEQSRALVNAQARFRAKDMELDSLQAYGDFEIHDGDLLRMRIFAPIADMITNLPNLIDKQEELINSGKIIPRKLTLYEKVSTNIKSGTAAVVGVFTKGIGMVGSAFGQTTSNIPGANYLLNYDLRNASANFMIGDGVLSTNNLRATGSNLAVSSSLRLDLARMYIQADLWPEMSSLISLMLSPITVISDGIIDINLYGTLDDLRWRVIFNRWNETGQDADLEFKLNADRHFEEVERKKTVKE
ncbi:MAG: AsmA-like C-terminal region-containing protein [Akkermansia sp.]